MIPQGRKHLWLCEGDLSKRLWSPQAHIQLSFVTTDGILSAFVMRVSIAHVLLVCASIIHASLKSNNNAKVLLPVKLITCLNSFLLITALENTSYSSQFIDLKNPRMREVKLKVTCDALEWGSWVGIMSACIQTLSWFPLLCVSFPSLNFQACIFGPQMQVPLCKPTHPWWDNQMLHWSSPCHCIPFVNRSSEGVT